KDQRDREREAGKREKEEIEGYDDFVRWVYVCLVAQGRRTVGFHPQPPCNPWMLTGAVPEPDYCAYLLMCRINS
ncbi:hypothetical protein M8C21_013442, partial [Ambrosia artemisiifolia]